MIFDLLNICNTLNFQTITPLNTFYVLGIFDHNGQLEKHPCEIMRGVYFVGQFRYGMT